MNSSRTRRARAVGVVGASSSPLPDLRGSLWRERRARGMSRRSSTIPTGCDGLAWSSTVRAVVAIVRAFRGHCGDHALARRPRQQPGTYYDASTWACRRRRRTTTAALSTTASVISCTAIIIMMIILLLVMLMTPLALAMIMLYALLLHRAVPRLPSEMASGRRRRTSAIGRTAKQTLPVASLGTSTASGIRRAENGTEMRHLCGKAET